MGEIERHYLSVPI